MGFVAAIFGGLGSLFGGGGLFGGIFGKLFGGLLKSFTSGLLGGKKGGGGAPSQSRTLAVKQAITSKKIVYGRIKAAGPIILFEAEGGKKDKEFMHMIVPVAAHEIESFGTVYMDQAAVILDADGECIGSGPMVGTWVGGVLTLDDPNSPALTEAEVDQDVKLLWAATDPFFEETVTTSIGSYSSATRNLLISEVSLQDLSLAVRDEVRVQVNSTTVEARARVDAVSGGNVTIRINSKNEDTAEELLIAGANVSITKIGDSGSSKSVTITAIDKDAGTFTFDDPSAFADGSKLWAKKIDGKALNGVEFKGNLRVNLHLGSPTQSADADAVEEITGWTEDHKLSGIAYMYCRFKHDNEAYPNGLPNPSVVLQGKKVYDPRTATTVYSSNPALCVRDYLLDDKLGLGHMFTSADIDDATVIAAANICEETVAISGGTENRYDCAGIVDTEKKPSKNIESLLVSMAGELTQVGGKWKVYAGAYTAGTLELDESDLAGPIDVQTRLGRRELFNGVKGVYISENNFWQESDYPTVTNSAYVSADGGSEIWKDLDLDFTSSSATAQRLAKIHLQRARQPITVKALFKPKALQLEPTDTVLLTNSDLGWTQKEFLVTELKWSIINDDAGIPYMGAELELRETASTVYDWDWSADQVLTDSAPNTGLTSIFAVTEPDLISMESGTDQLQLNGDGTVQSRILVTWTDPLDQFVKSGGQIEFQTRLQGTDEWNPGGFFNTNTTNAYIPNVTDGVYYTVRARFINSVGVNSAWSDEFAHKVIGKSAPPQDVLNFVVVQNGALTSFSWAEVTDVDIKGYEIRYGPQGGAIWENGTQLVTKKAGNVDTSAIVPPGDHTFMIKAVDTSGNYSSNATKFSASITNTFVVDTELTLAEYAETGTNVNLEVHTTNALTLISDEGADISADIFDNNNLTFSNVGYHTTPEVDLGSDTSARIWANITSTLLPGISTGTAQPEFQLRYRLDGESFTETSLEDLNFLEATGSVFTNCVLHHGGWVVPESQDLASVDGVMDEFAQNAYDEWSYTSPEIDLGADTSILLNITANAMLGPGETGTANYTVEIDRKADGGSYVGFSSFTGGRVNARYIKFKINSNSATGKTKIGNVQLSVDDFQTWTVGDVTARYIQGRIKVDPAIGVMSIQDYNITIDTET